MSMNLVVGADGSFYKATFDNGTVDCFFVECNDRHDNYFMNN